MRYLVPLGLIVLTATSAAPAPAQAGSASTGSGRASVQVLSGRPDTVTGGDALVRVAGATGRVTVTIDSESVTDSFRPAGEPHTLVGRIAGLDPGANRLTVRSGRRVVATAVLTNHPAAGPVFSGPHHRMYCTADRPPWNLGPVDADCHVAAPVVSYQYRTVAGQWAALPAAGPLPADAATTTTTAGRTVPYVVRIERGTINRAVYETAILHTPATPLPDPWTTTPAWNGKLVYAFGGGCGVGYHQGTTTGGVLHDVLLRQGYAVASATLNVYQNNCDDVTSAETAMMVKERFVEAYGAPAFTMGFGGSAGTMQQLLISNAYPGIIDGVVGEIGYPDERSITKIGHDCRVILDYLDRTSLSWTQEQKTAVSGLATFATCSGFNLFPGVDFPLQGCPVAVPVADRYHPVTNPTGLRCTIADMVRNVYGVDRATGFGRRVSPDNVGVQYGLRTLNDGTISVEQFLDLNAGVGGFDVDGNRTTARSEASPAALRRAYATGRINEFTGGLRRTPVIEMRGYTDPLGDFHDRYRSWMMRERIIAATGSAATQVSWTAPPGPVYAQVQARGIAGMDSWLTRIKQLEASQPRLDPALRTRLARPAGLADGCFTADGTKVDEKLTYNGPGVCNSLYPYHGDTRLVAGGPLAGDVLKCQLKRVDPGDYRVWFTPQQWRRLGGIFPAGVCDWRRPGVGQTRLEGTWLRF